jgi:hypothetical protein
MPIPITSRVFPALSCTNFRVPGLTLRSLIHFQLNYYKVIYMDLVSVFCRWVTTFPATFLEEAVLSPSYIFGAFVKNKVGWAVRTQIQILYSVPLVFMSVFVLIPCCFYAIAL